MSPNARRILAAAVAMLVLPSCAVVRRSPVSRPRGGAEVSPSLVPGTGRSLKRKVAVARFTNETLYGKSVLLEDRADLVARQASDIHSARLAESGKFLLFERSDADRILRAIDEGSLDELGLPADYLILGSVAEFGRETVSRTGVWSRTKLQRARARVNVRLVDVRTSRVIFADEGAGEAFSEAGTVLGIGTRASYDSTLNDQAISAAISKVVNNLLERLLDQPWRSWVLAVGADAVTIGGGPSQGIAAGDRFALVRRGETVRNPQTSAAVELPGEKVGVLEVTSVAGATPEDEVARCRVVSGEAPEGDLSRYVVEEDLP